MSGPRRFLLGGLGALAPSAVNFLVVDISNVFSALTPLVLAFYGVRLAVLSAIGGLMAYFEREETAPGKLFRLGIVAPAMIVALVNGANVQKTTGALPWEGVAHAQYAFPACVRAGAKLFTLPAPTYGEQIQQGLTGKASGRTWFVLAGVHKALETARIQQKWITGLQRKGWSNALYCAPDRRHPTTPFVVVVGEHLDLPAADMRLKEAIAAGLVRAFLFDLAAGEKG